MRCFNLFYSMSAVLSESGENEFEDQLKKIGDRIKELRLAKGDAFEKFAYKNDISRSQLTRFEKGNDMQITSLLKVLKGLEVSLEDFFGKGFN